MKKILFVHDLLSGSTDLFVQEFLDRLSGFQTMVPELPPHPQEALQQLKDLAERERPDLVVGWLSGGFLAQQFFGYDRVLISPDYQFSVLLETLLDDKEETRVPYLFERGDGRKELVVTPALIQEYRTMERSQFDGIPSSRHPVFGFFWVDRNTDNCRIHSAHYSDVTYLPGKDYLDAISIQAICDMIKCWQEG